MTEQEIIEMAKQAHVGSKTWVDIYSDQITVGEVRDFLKAFAKLVAQHEREACARVCDDMDSISDYYTLRVELICAQAIRARGEQA